ncbi:hypothetical protein LOTGIDRAFT_160945 [Lottia gigantea]|uniref:Uncharacterized protein n=1 Tax=Lottia gigantea TaxID=225164 RepID=V4ACY0_LOTGI|nr:hypothetical protein LOTGIDRAFT_160945 [Lottia gigantea]ESO94712.1 hypothetical protein LOTGIDRAFT_160945 [Lottia gigantea]
MCLSRLVTQKKVFFQTSHWDLKDFTEYGKCIMIETSAMLKGFEYKYCLVNGQRHEFERVHHMIKRSGYRKEANRTFIRVLEPRLKQVTEYLRKHLRHKKK